MEAGSAVARTTSRTARPCAAGAATPRSPHVREEASHSRLLDPRERPREGALLFTRGTVARVGTVHDPVHARE